MKKNSFKIALSTIVTSISAIICNSMAEEVNNLSIRPSQVQIPEGANLGSYRRTIHPFKNWELICDENLILMEKICNITQTIVDSQNSIVFGLSLASTPDGNPMFIVRTSSSIDVSKPITLLFGGELVSFSMNEGGCNHNICAKIIDLNKNIIDAINSGLAVEVKYYHTNGEFKFSAPLSGLSEALEAIR